MEKTHIYNVSSTIRKSEKYIHLDDTLYNGLFRKLIRLHQILEPWNFGLSYEVKEQVFWLNLDEDTYSSIDNFPKDQSGNIILSFGVITYPLSLTDEIWSQAALEIFFNDIYKCEQSSSFLIPRKIEMYALEHWLAERRESKDLCPINTRLLAKEIQETFKGKINEFADMTCFQLIKRYFEIIGQSDFEKITGDFSCDDRACQITMTNRGFKMTVKNKKSTYDWDKVKLAKQNGEFCGIILSKNSGNEKRKLKFDSKLQAKQFHFVMWKHLCQYTISSKASIDAEFRIIKELTTAEQKWPEKAQELEKQIKDFAKFMEEKKSLEKKTRMQESKILKVAEYEKEIKNSKFEIEKLKNEKKNDLEKYKRDVEGLKKKISMLEERLRRSTTETKLEKRPSLTETFMSHFIPVKTTVDIDFESGVKDENEKSQDMTNPGDQSQNS